MRGVYYSACSLCYKTIGAIKQKCLLMRDCLLLPEYTVFTIVVFGFVRNTENLRFAEKKGLCKNWQFCHDWQYYADCNCIPKHLDNFVLKFLTLSSFD